jgi:hypothetical protein
MKIIKAFVNARVQSWRRLRIGCERSKRVIEALKIRKIRTVRRGGAMIESNAPRDEGRGVRLWLDVTVLKATVSGARGRL